MFQASSHGLGAQRFGLCSRKACPQTGACGQTECRFAQATQNIGGCGGAEKLAADFKAEVVESDGVKMRELPPALQEMMMPMQVGQATRPFGSLTEGVRVLVICGRDESDPTMPTYDQVLAQMNEERVNLRARRYLRDLRRDDARAVLKHYGESGGDTY